MPRKYSLLALLAVVLLWPLAVLADDSPAAEGQPAGQELPAFYWYDGMWTHERSDIPPDPEIHFGRLANGLRYAVVPNELPPGRVTMQLDVQVGSLMEERGQRGYAHFLEHMAFNGSRRFGPGALIPFFQQHGMGFGSDTNAYTTQQETVYKLNLASNDEKSMRQGLDVLRDFADGLTLAPVEVDDEKGVILAEKRDRENEVMLAGRAWRRKLYGENNPLAMDAIGTEECIRNATSEKLKRFYEKWYRADRMILVIVGSVTPEVVEPMVEAAFGSMEKPAAPLPFPTIAEPIYGVGPSYVQKRPVDFVTETLMVLHPRRHVADIKENELMSLVDGVAHICLQNRLSQRMMAKGAPWTRAGYRADWRSGLAPRTTFMAFSAPSSLERALDAMEVEYSSALTYGFTHAELQTALTQLENGFKRRIKTMPQRKSADRAEEIISRSNDDEVVCSPRYDLKCFEAYRRQITPDLVLTVLRQAFDGKKVLYISGGTEITEKEVTAMWDAFARREPVKPVEQENITLPYLPLPPVPASLPILVERKVPLPAGEITMYEGQLPGGVNVHLMPMPELEKVQVRVSLVFGHGISVMDPMQVDVANMAENVVSVAGPGRLTLQDRSVCLTSRGVELDESVNSYATIITGNAPGQEVSTLLTALWTQYVDPMPYPQAEERYEKVQDSLGRMRASRFGTVDGVSKACGFAHFAGERFLPLDADRAKHVTLDDVRIFIARTHSTELRDVLVTGNFDPRAILPELTRLFSRKEEATVASAPVQPCVFPTESRTVMTVERETLDKAVIRMAWRKDIDPTDRRKMAVHHLVAAVLRDRMREVLRERMGATYSPFAVYRNLDAHGGFGFVLLNAKTSSERADEVVDVITEMSREFATKGVTEQDLARLRKPMLTAWESNGKNAAVRDQLLLLEVSSGRPFMQWNAEYGDLLRSVTVEEVSTAAAELFAQQPAVLIVKNGPKAQKPEQRKE